MTRHFVSDSERAWGEGGDMRKVFDLRSKELEAEAKEARRPKTTTEQMTELSRQIDYLSNAIVEGYQDESGARAERKRLMDELAELRAKVQAEGRAAFLAEWTPEVTAERRKAWNDMVRAGKFGAAGSGRVDWTALRNQESEQGWTHKALLEAIKHHNL